uniref:Tyrosine-protein phosphatase non-receptor type 9 n=1 Tax=Mesocestoides corti TaxID=53468 RepID=A0A5K3ETW3_MESCO
MAPPLNPEKQSKQPSFSFVLESLTFLGLGSCTNHTSTLRNCYPIWS